jgi:methionine-rich copper-binding protein CopC
MKTFAKSIAAITTLSAITTLGLSGIAHAATPTLSSTSPATLATGVAIDANIVLTFSEAVSAEEGSITIIRFSDKSVFETIRVGDSSKVSLSGAIVTINPASTFAYNTRYAVLVDATAFDSVSTDDSFGGIQSEGTLNFTTVAAAATTTTPTTIATTTTTIAAQPLILGKRCPKVGATRTVNGVKLVCKKTTRNVWRRA